MKSIRRYLLFSLLLSLLAGTALIAAVIYLNTKHETDELFDEHLRQLARTILGQQTAFIDATARHEFTSQSRKLKGEEEFLIQIFDRQVGLVYSSHPNIALPYYGNAHVNEVVFTDRHWKTFTASSEKWHVQVSQPYGARREMISEIGMNNLIPIIIQIPLLGLLFWIAVGRSLQPLDDISATIRAKMPGNLELIGEDGVPVEIRPLVSELDSLLLRQHKALELQRTFTSDAAHELRTPLAAIQLQADLLARSTTDIEKIAAKAKLEVGIGRAAYLVNQLLVLARAETIGSHKSRALLSPLIKEALAFHASLLDKKGIVYKLSLDETIEALVDRVSLVTALSSLIDNSLKYAPAGSRLDIALTQAEHGIEIEINDEGPGIPATDLLRVFDRFYRVAGTNSMGTGLGLAIAKTIIEQHGGKIILLNRRPNGLTAKIILPG